MIRTTTLTLAAALLAGSTFVANAYPMINDTGAPVSAGANAYVDAHASRANAAGRHGNVYMLEDRASPRTPVYGYGSSYTDYTSHYGSFDDKQRPW